MPPMGTAPCALAARGCACAMSRPRAGTWKRRASRAVEKRTVNRLIGGLVVRGRLGSTYALLETTGRRSGRMRRTPVASGLRGDTFWLLAAHGRHAHYVHNICANPRVRVGVAERGAMRWRSGTAALLPGDDARARQRALARGRLGYTLDALLLRALATDLLTIRIDLDPREVERAR